MRPSSVPQTRPSWSRHVPVALLRSLVLLLLLTSRPAAADQDTPPRAGADADADADADAARVFTESLVSALAQVATDADLDESARRDALRTTLRERLAVGTIGRFLFRGTPDDLADAAQRARYHALFPDYIAAAFADQIGSLAERHIEVQDVRIRNEREAIVRSDLLDNAGKTRATIDWRLRWQAEGPRLLDVLVERISPLVRKRQEFSALAARDGVEALLVHMEDAVAR